MSSITGSHCQTLQLDLMINEECSSITVQLDLMINEECSSMTVQLDLVI